MWDGLFCHNLLHQHSLHGYRIMLYYRSESRLDCLIGNCCWIVPSHYLTQCWFIISEIFIKHISNLFNDSAVTTYDNNVPETHVFKMFFFPGVCELTSVHSVGWVIISSGNGLLPFACQAITWIIVELSSTLRNTLKSILDQDVIILIQENTFKISYAKCCPFRRGPNTHVSWILFDRCWWWHGDQTNGSTFPWSLHNRDI